MSNIANIAATTIAAARNKTVLRTPDGVTEDIIREILATDKVSRKDTKDFAGHLVGNTPIQTLQNNWNFVKDNIKYVVDPSGDQYVKTPARTWSDKFADCKSYSIFLASLLKNQGFEFSYRFASYGSTPIYTHVYIVVPLNGREIIIDDVMPTFNSEKAYNFKKDIPMTKIYNMSGIGADLPKVTKKVDFNFGNKDISEMSEGEMDLWIARDRFISKKANFDKIKGIGSLQAERAQDTIDMLEDAIEAVQKATVNGIGALTSPDLDEELMTIAFHAITGIYSIANEIHGIGATKKKAARQKRKADRKEIRKDFKGKDRATKMAEWRKANGTKTGKFLQKVATKVKAGAKAFAKVLSAPLRLISKGILETTLPKAAPAFLYLFVTDPNIIAKLPEAAREKRKKQEKIFKFIVDGVGMKENHLMGILRNGIIKHMGDEPEKIIAKAMAGKVSGIGDIFDSAGKIAGGFLTKIFDWLKNLFKGKKNKQKELDEIDQAKTEAETNPATVVFDATNPDEKSTEVAADIQTQKSMGNEPDPIEEGSTSTDDGAGGKSIWNSFK